MGRKSFFPPLGWCRGGGGGGGGGEGGRSQKREAVELKLPAQCMLSISQVHGNLIRIKKIQFGCIK